MHWSIWFSIYARNHLYIYIYIYIYAYIYIYIDAITHKWCKFYEYGNKLYLFQSWQPSMTSPHVQLCSTNWHVRWQKSARVQHVEQREIIYFLRQRLQALWLRWILAMIIYLGQLTISIECHSMKPSTKGQDFFEHQRIGDQDCQKVDKLY